MPGRRQLSEESPVRAREAVAFGQIRSSPYAMPGRSRNSPLPDSEIPLTQIILIEDHAILRDGLCALLSLESDFSIVGEAATVSAGCAIVERLRPDLVLTDLALPDGSGLEIIQHVKRLDPCPRIIVLTAHFSEEYVRAVIDVGADGYILKDASRGELIEGIRTVLGGTQYFSQAVASKVLSGYLGLSPVDGKSESDVLTTREKEVLKMIALAYSNKEIATALTLSVKTVEKHRSNLMQKLKLHNTAAVTLYAIRNKMVPIDVVGGAATDQVDWDIKRRDWD
jgi:DNA-binding NarL/FixJ family response regulator